MKNQITRAAALLVLTTSLSVAQNVFPAFGSVGVGVNTPSHLFEVRGGFFHTTHNTASIPPSDGFGGLTIGWNRIGGGSAEVNLYNVYNNAPKSFIFSQKTGASTYSDLMTIQSNGHVGIGSTAPEQILHAKKMGDASLRLESISYRKWDIVSSGGQDAAYSGHFAIVDATSTTKNRFDIDPIGNVGIGCDAPQAQLHLKRSGSSPLLDAVIRLESTYNQGRKWDILSSGGSGIVNSGWFAIVDVAANKAPLKIDMSGRVFFDVVQIGSQSVPSRPSSLLTVSGEIDCKSLFVLKPTTWQDRVFQKNYTLPKLVDVERYIIENEHLPGIKSEKEIIANGYDVNEVDALLLEKIENLYLYIIQQEKEINALKAKLEK